MELFGYYIAEGCLSQRKGKPEGIVFSINSQEKDFTNRILHLMKELYGRKGRVRDDTRHRRTIRFYSVKIGNWFKQMFKSGAHNKIIPDKFLYFPKDKQKKLIYGLWRGDGSVYYDKTKKASEIEYQTVSQQLGWRIFNILIRLGFIPSLKISARKSDVYSIKVCGRQKWEFIKIIKRELKDKAKGNQQGWIDNNYAYLPVISNKKEEYSGKVYDLNIKDTHTYVTTVQGHNSGEGFGLMPVESMACGVPVIVPNNSCYSDDTEVMTKEGIKLVRDLIIGEEVMTIDEPHKVIKD